MEEARLWEPSITSGLHKAMSRKTEYLLSLELALSQRTGILICHLLQEMCSLIPPHYGTFLHLLTPSWTIPPYLDVRAPHAAQHKLDYGVEGLGRGQPQLLLSLTRRDSLGWPLWKREAGSAKPLHSAAPRLPAGLRPGATPSERAAKKRARIEMDRKTETGLKKIARLGFGKGGNWCWSYFIYSFFLDYFSAVVRVMQITDNCCAVRKISSTAVRRSNPQKG